MEEMGVGLNDEQRQRLDDINHQLSSLYSQFGDNVMDSTKEFQLEVRREEEGGGGSGDGGRGSGGGGDDDGGGGDMPLSF